MHLPWSREHKLERIHEMPFPSSWEDYLLESVAHFKYLSSDEQVRLRDSLRLFIDEKQWEATGDLVLTDEMKVVVAAQACMLTLNLPHINYRNVESIVLYASAYTASLKDRDASGVVTEAPQSRAGEAWMHGPIVIGWNEAVRGFRHPDDGHNVVLHEFAHKLDATDGSMDGVPLLETEEQIEPYAAAMSALYREVVKEANHGKPRLLDKYGATNEAEFFAVATEVFFEEPVQMRHIHPAAYAVLKDFYRQDTAERVERERADRAGDQ